MLVIDNENHKNKSDRYLQIQQTTKKYFTKG